MKQRLYAIVFCNDESNDDYETLISDFTEKETDAIINLLYAFGYDTYGESIRGSLKDNADFIMDKDEIVIGE